MGLVFFWCYVGCFSRDWNFLCLYWWMLKDDGRVFDGWLEFVVGVSSYFYFGFFYVCYFDFWNFCGNVYLRDVVFYVYVWNNVGYYFGFLVVCFVVLFIVIY